LQHFLTSFEIIFYGNFIVGAWDTTWGHRYSSSETNTPSNSVFSIAREGEWDSRGDGEMGRWGDGESGNIFLVPSTSD